jgi:VanZ family protein
LSGVVPTHEALEATAGRQEDLAASLGHFVEYAVLAFALAVAFGGWRVEARALALAGGVSIALGWAMEVVQLSLPYRDFQVSDGLVDMAGAAAGLLVFSVVALSVRERRPERP